MVLSSALVPDDGSNYGPFMTGPCKAQKVHDPAFDCCSKDISRCKPASFVYEDTFFVPVPATAGLFG
jgi:hypothetical protein